MQRWMVDRSTKVRKVHTSFETMVLVVLITNTTSMQEIAARQETTLVLERCSTGLGGLKSSVRQLVGGQRSHDRRTTAATSGLWKKKSTGPDLRSRRPSSMVAARKQDRLCSSSACSKGARIKSVGTLPCCAVRNFWPSAYYLFSLCSFMSMRS